MSVAPRVSIVIPTYQRSASLERTLDAIVRCEVPPGGLEVLVVDDGSTDDTEVVARAAVLPLRYLRQTNAGPATARNRGWRAAAGDLVLFTDDDTVPTATWIVDMVAAADADPGAGAVGGHVVPIRRGFVEDFVQVERLVRHAVDNDGAVRYLVTANALFRREALEAVGGFDQAFPSPAGEDVDLSYRLRGAGWELRVTDAGVVAHDHPASLGQVLRTLRRHGAARDHLAGRHGDASAAAGARRVLVPREWVARYRRYRREGIPKGRALVYLALRAVGLGAYLIGILWSRRGRTDA